MITLAWWYKSQLTFPDEWGNLGFLIGLSDFVFGTKLGIFEAAIITF